MQFQEGSIYFNSIRVLQSLAGEDRLTGTEIHSDTIARAKLRDPNLSTSIHDIAGEAELFEILNEIELASRTRGLLPFIHFETHGTQDGLLLASDKEVKWAEIMPCIKAINANTGNNLFVSVAACWGGSIQHQVNIMEPSPFRGFIGPMDEIYEIDILTCFTAFFEELLLTDDFDKAITRLKATNRSGVEFHHLNSEAFFDHVLNYHMELITAKSEETRVFIDKVFDSSGTPVLPRISKNGFYEFLVANPERYRELFQSKRDVFLHRKPEGI